MEQRIQQPRNIFEQIAIGQQITNENIVALSENLAVVNAKVDALLAIFTSPPVRTKDSSEPGASGADKDEQ